MIVIIAQRLLFPHRPMMPVSRRSPVTTDVVDHFAVTFEPVVADGQIITLADDHLQTAGGDELRSQSVVSVIPPDRPLGEFTFRLSRLYIGDETSGPTWSGANRCPVRGPARVRDRG
ncbi:Uncharacterised protein [Mycobacteroides abscessus subsp. abscessus]|nr:Uncharacterised protein [Mycobacteroides abscessus subsp. abscessus]SHY35926.1 Uncharacterised protein [Mycobacteroides abscessus subsp. abscessus]SIL57250.1 Uncharacterised protein [Mycobacteroides abscessus subsp. abscessus]